MRLLNIFIAPQPQPEEAKKVVASSNVIQNGSYVVNFDGEKNEGDIGPILTYNLDHMGLRARSWQAYLDSEIARTVLNRFSIWIIDKGLKLQCAPERTVLKSEGIDLNVEAFNKITEARFSTFSKSKHASFSGMQSLNSLAQEAFKNCKIGGDVLVILRYIDDTLKVELIDGAHLQTPFGQTLNKNIIDGVEIDSTGRHIAYHVRIKNLSFRRVLARSASTGLITAFLVKGNAYKIDDQRGIPTISTSLETLKKIERYKEAAVGSAEERQKIVYQVVHGKSSDGENPNIDQVTKALHPDRAHTPVDSSGIELANTVAASTNKETYNMPIDSELKSLESKNEMFFKEFYSTNADIICGSIGIPPNVAFSIYNDSFSASRAATKDWEHTIEFERNQFQTQFYDPIFAFWLFNEVLLGKIQAPNFLVAFNNNNWMVTEAYLNSRFTGSMFPHIDPVKEVTAERLKLGNLAGHMPLTTVEAATDKLMGGDSTSNMEQFVEELDAAKEKGLETAEIQSNQENNNIPDDESND